MSTLYRVIQSYVYGSGKSGIIVASRCYTLDTFHGAFARVYLNGLLGVGEIAFKNYKLPSAKTVQKRKGFSTTML